MKALREKLTYANVMSSIAVFLVVGGGTAFALAKNSVGTRELKPKAVKTGILAKNAVRTGKLGPEAVKGGKLAKNAVSTNRLRNNAVTGAKVNESSLSTVPSAQTANSASTAGTATTAGEANGLSFMSPFKLTKTTSSATGLSLEAAREAATPITLYEDNHFRLYAKCFIDNSTPELYAYVYIATKQDGAIYEGDNGGETNGSTGYLNTGTPEPEREVIFEGVGLNSADLQFEGDNEFGATAADGHTLLGALQVAVKYGVLAAGDGPYGPGDACLISGYVFHT